LLRRTDSDDSQSTSNATPRSSNSAGRSEAWETSRMSASCTYMSLRATNIVAVSMSWLSRISEAAGHGREAGSGREPMNFALATGEGRGTLFSASHHLPIHTSTLVPLRRCAPGAGRCLITRPVRLFVDFTCLILPTRQCSFVILTFAGTSFVPISIGTTHFGGAVTSPGTTAVWVESAAAEP